MTEPTGGFTFSDRRRVDPVTGQVREQATPAPAPGDPEAAAVDAAVAAAEVADAAVAGQVAELTADLQRIHAEYANYRKRVERDRVLIRDQAVASTLAELLPVLDDVARAREHGELEGGFKAVGESLEITVARLGLVPYGTEGEPFDPTRHEALTHEERAGVSGPTVAVVYAPGYAYGDRVIRPARVGVVDAADDSGTAEGAGTPAEEA